MKIDKTKTEAEEPYQNVYEQYYLYNSEWHNWQKYIGGVITANGANCEYFKSQLSELEKYMLESILGGKWYEHNCPNLMKNEPNTTGFLFWWKKRYEGKLQPLDDTESKVDECNTFFFNYSKWQYLKSLFADTEPQQIGIPEELQTDEAKAIFAKAIKAGLMKSTETGCYQWNKSKTLLAYFAQTMSGYLHLSNKQHNGKYDTSWKPFEIAFNQNRLKDAKQSWLKDNYKESEEFYPDGFEKISQLFEK